MGRMLPAFSLLLFFNDKLETMVRPGVDIVWFFPFRSSSLTVTGFFARVSNLVL